MKRLILFALLFALQSVRAATGDILGAEMVNHWQMRVYIDHMATNGTVYTGLGTNDLNNTKPNLLDSQFATIVLTTTDMGFDTNCQPTTLQRKLYGTSLIRVPYQGAAADGSGGTSANGSTTHTDHFQFTTNAITGVITMLISMNDRVYQRSSNLVATFGRFYTANAVQNNAATSVTVTNGSTEAYPVPIPESLGIPWMVKQGAKYWVQMTGGDLTADNGKIFQAVKFWGICGARTNQPVVATDMVISPDDNAVPVPVFGAWLDNTVFNQLDQVTNFWAAYPIMGDTAVDLTGNAGEYQSTNDWGRIPAFVTIADPNSTLVSTYARVATDGTLGAASFTNLWSDDPAAAITAGTSAFATVQQALTNAMKTNQVVWGANSNLVPITLLMSNGNHAAVGGASVAITMPQAAWVTVMADPNTGRDNAALTSKGAGQFNSGSRDVRWRLKNMTINTTASLYNDGFKMVALDHCVCVSNGNSSVFYFTSFTNGYAVRNIMGRYRAGFKFKQVNGNQQDKWRVVGNTWTNQIECLPRVFIGNLGNPPAGQVWQHTIQNDIGGGSVAPTNALQYMRPFIFAFNKFYNVDATVLMVGWGLNCTNTADSTCFQNLIEGCKGDYPALDVLQSATPQESMSNVWVALNTDLTTYHRPFNHETNQVKEVHNYRNVLNIHGKDEIGVDTSAGGPTGQQNGGRSNMLDLAFGVGDIGQVSGRYNTTANYLELAGGTQGVYGYIGANGYYCGDQTISNSVAFKFVNNQSNTNGTSTASAGFGDYSLAANSPLLTPHFSNPYPLKYDINGRIRMYPAYAGCDGKTQPNGWY